MTHANAAESVRIKPATPADVPLILAFVKELAEYERSADKVVADEESLRESLFGERSVAEGRIAYVGGEPAGMALFFHNFSTWTGLRGLYLEDLYVRPEMRGRGVGRRLLAHLARLARERDCARFEWAVLNWNEPAIGFYQSLGAVPMDEWRIYRLTGDALDRLAEEA
ncbi:MAG TPA: GNAT family N-acetyltransferase [Pyrinomonadaceae bacterium]